MIGEYMCAVDDLCVSDAINFHHFIVIKNNYCVKYTSESSDVDNFTIYGWKPRANIDAIVQHDVKLFGNV